MNPHTHRGYWIPYEGTADVYTWIENSVIKDFIEDIATQHIWLIADSCFSGTFLTKTRNIAFEVTYNSLDQKKSRWMLASGGEEKVSDGIPGSNSPFCKYLIKFLTVNTSKFTCTSEIIKYVQILTKNNSTQTPRGAYIDNIGHENGEMILTLRAEYTKNITKITRGTASTPELRAELAKNIEAKNKLATGKEILLVESFIEDYDYLILENFRFDDDGVKKMKFSQNQVILKSLDDEEKLYLIRRFATWQGTTRYLELNDGYYKSSKVAIIHAREDIENVEEELHCIAHADYLQELIDFNSDTMSCLHCGEKISTNDSFLVEIDELNLRDSVGNVHKECLRPADRIMGQSGYEGLEDSNLINFDFNRWVSLLEKGQGQLKGINNRLDNISIAIVSWNPDHNRNEGNYCISIVVRVIMS